MYIELVLIALMFAYFHREIKNLKNSIRILLRIEDADHKQILENTRVTNAIKKWNEDVQKFKENVE